MDLRKIKKLIDLLEESNLAEIEIKEGEESVRLARTPQGGMVQGNMYAMAPAAYAQPAPAATAPMPMPMQSPTEAATGGHAKAGADLPDGLVLRSPLGGTFYASRAP
jgi:acetyl-CoA carboxylase biotin carboxyl carrier protein